MAWIEAHQSLAKHPKVLHACELLRRPRPTVIGHLILLWWWALDAAPDGGPLHIRDIKAGADWPGKAERFVDVLVAVGLLDEDKGGYWLHDWDDYAGRLLDRRAANAERQRVFREKITTQRKNPARADHKSLSDDAADSVSADSKQGESNAHVTVTSQLRNGATQPNPTEPNPTEPNRQPPPARDHAHEEAEPAPGAALDDPAVAAYEATFGAATPATVEGLLQYRAQCPVSWIEQAVGEAQAKKARRPWPYVKAMLDRWLVEGPPEASGRSPPGRDGLAHYFEGPLGQRLKARVQQQEVAS